MSRYYVLTGSGNMRRGQGKGIGVYLFSPEDGELKMTGRYLEEVNVGYQLFQPETGRLYLTDEYMSQPGKTGGGGSILSAVFDPVSGSVTETGRVKSLGTNPSYLCVEKSGGYLIAVHHCTEQFAVKVIRNSAGVYDTETVFDDCAAVLFRLRQDGTVGEACDVLRIPGEYRDGRYRMPHLHSITAVPGRNCYLAADKGLDRIYSLEPDLQKGLLKICGTTEAAAGSAPRYGAFHPKLQLYYGNCEESAVLTVYRVSEDGRMTLLQSCPILMPEEEPEEGCGVHPSDLKLSPDGRTAYVSVRDSENGGKIAVLRIGPDGLLTLLQNIPCFGENPRGICLTLDGALLFAAEPDQGMLEVFHVQPDGRLTLFVQKTVGGCPGNLEILPAE